MSKSKKSKILLSSDDFYRVLITDTQPYHMPIIFNNYGLYNAIDKSKKSIDFYEIFIKDLGLTNVNSSDFLNNKYTIPFEYQISKNIHSFRSLKLIHPLDQLRFVDFYRKFYTIILYNCGRSEFSLRYPSKVNSAVFRLKNDDIYQKLMSEDDLDECQSNEHKVDIENNNQEFASSFFSYKKFEFNYKFYDSVDFLRLEKKFVYLVMLDVAHCFDSIYTHSISWAIKGKKYIKDNLNKPKENSFEDGFDNLMQSINYNETNGIVIGAEFSRIFAELIFQRIDFEIQKELEKKYQIKHNEHYAIRRYVDDYCIFFKEKEDEDKILEVISNKLKSYNLSLNMAKTKYFQRPFITQRSRNIAEIRRFLLSKMSEIIYLKNDENGKCYFLDGNKLKNPQHRANEFIREIKSYWNINDDLNSGFSGYVIKAFLSQILKFIRYSDSILNDEKNNCNPVINFLLFMFEVSLYCFTIDPNVSNSIEFSKIVIFIDRLIGNNQLLSNYQERFRYTARNSLLELLDNELSNQKATLIERLNILLTYCEISESEIENDNVKKYLFGINGDEYNYFSLIVALFIFKNKDYYHLPKNEVVNKIKDKIAENPIKAHSETFHLYLDCMSCPYLNDNEKIEITKIFLPTLNCNDNAQKIVSKLKKYSWFVDWKNIDFLRYLKKKQLRNAY
ncbi:Reverse transcriptase (RNA-dependent DNA polymerase) [Moraxella caprae]|uniref:Reverse transcriptase (RNA-dependent DNA polymerase) n=1 Tax=Moraxella caprae TaxID=90240 RepID=A0A378QXZ9_9GAMM|nr:antiviral reverse transcriptase Drt3b [Moraxella caprae]STZ07439.1 Reverse transcriptase (RNA-dependent DNA polymerase) [Moraxella caprae]